MAIPPTVLLPLLLALLPSRLSCFNLETLEAQLYTDPSLALDLGEVRESYFGFTVALMNRQSDNTGWLVVGAPRANSSYHKYNPSAITEPGVVFKCSLEEEECQELTIDQKGNTISTGHNSEYNYHDLKNHGWLGGALDSQPTYGAQRQATAVCAPRWTNQDDPSNYLLNGACYWMNESLPDAPAHKKLPLIRQSRQVLNAETPDKQVFYYAHGQAGFSLHFPDDNTEMILGAPGVYNWRGTVIRFKDVTRNVGGGVARRRRRRRQVSRPDKVIPEGRMFSSEYVLIPDDTSVNQDFDLMGYAVTSGRFRKPEELLYVGGAPRGAGALGKVIMFSFPDWTSERLRVQEEWKGRQLGENFGASLVSADVNGDGLSDLVVGAPMHSLKDTPDAGRIQLFLSSQNQQLLAVEQRYHGSAKSYARFGTSLATLGDLNADGYEDVAVGAPWEDDGAVYIYLGSTLGLRQAYSQRLSPHDFSPGLRGFGMGLSRGIDVDNNGYPDLAIGSFLSGHTVVVRSRPVAYISGTLIADPLNIGLNDTVFALKACLSYRGFKVPLYVTINGNVTLDTAFPSPRAFFADTQSNTRKFSHVATAGQPVCLEYAVLVKEDKVDPREPIHIRLEYDLPPPAPYSLIGQPRTEPGVGTLTTSRVGIVTGCEADGDDLCLVNMEVSSVFNKFSDSNTMIIGEDNKPVLSVIVENSGEPVFLPNLTVKVDPPLSLLLPPTHDCVFNDADVRTSLQCRLANPITMGGRDKVDVTIDASQLSDRSMDTAISLEVSGEGLELAPLDNAITHTLGLSAAASLMLHGYSREEQLVYQRLKDGIINTTLVPSFLHTISLVKEGPTPLGQVEFVLDIPVNISSTNNFLKIYNPKASFLGEPVTCTITGSTFSIPEAKPKKTKVTKKKKSKEKKKKGIKKTEGAEREEEQADLGEANLVEAIMLNCTNPLVSCAQIRCLISAWPSDAASAEFSVRMDMNLTVLADHISAASGAIFASQARASILTLNPAISFIGNKEVRLEVQTYLLPDRLPMRGVPWWVILLAILGGLALLGATSYVLYKMGFFQRAEHEELMAHQATIESNGIE